MQINNFLIIIKCISIIRRVKETVNHNTAYIGMYMCRYSSAVIIRGQNIVKLRVI